MTLKRILVLFLLAAPLYSQVSAGPISSPEAAAAAATVTEQSRPVAYSDLYCNGFLSPTPLSTQRFVAGGLDTPLQSRYFTGELIFLRGTGYAPGARVSIVRHLKDPDRFDPFPGQSRRLNSAGELYGDIGYAVVLENRGTHMAVARVEFACDSVVDGDLVTPFAVRQPVYYRKSSTMDRFPAQLAAPIGQIVASRDFDQYSGAGHKVFLNVGSAGGVKPGDYLRIVRGYRKSEMDSTDAAVFSSNIYEDTQKDPPRLPHDELGDLPRRVIGEAVILSTRPHSASAMITFSLQEIQVGDSVEREQPPAR